MDPKIEVVNKLQLGVELYVRLHFTKLDFR